MASFPLVSTQFKGGCITKMFFLIVILFQCIIMLLLPIHCCSWEAYPIVPSLLSPSIRHIPSAFVSAGRVLLLILPPAIFLADVSPKQKSHWKFLQPPQSVKEIRPSSAAVLQRRQRKTKKNEWERLKPREQITMRSGKEKQYKLAKTLGGPAMPLTDVQKTFPRV